MSLTDLQRKTLTWVLECQIETTAEKAPDYEPHQAVEEIDGLMSLAILLQDERLASLCNTMRGEQQARIDALPPETDPLVEIQGLMNGTEWDADTLEDIAAILRKAGYEVNDPEDDDPAYDDQGNLRGGDA